MRREAATLLAAVLICLGTTCQADPPAGGSPEGRSPVYLEVDFRVDDPQFFAGGPVPFALRLRLAPGVPRAEVPATWYTEARIAVGGAGRAVEAIPMVAEPTRAMAARPNARTLELTPEKSGDSAYLVLPPGDTRDLGAGSHFLQVTVNVPGVGVLEQQAPFTIAVATTSAEKSRLALMAATYQVENQNDVEGAIATVENALRDTGDAALNYRLGWLYESRQRLDEAIAAYREYISWARASGIPRDHTRRGPQEIADELEQVITILQDRIDAPPASSDP